jgi:serine/threonine-protein kinase
MTEQPDGNPTVAQPNDHADESALTLSHASPTPSGSAAIPHGERETQIQRTGADLGQLPAREGNSSPTIVGRYTIRGEVGRGGMGIVLEAEDPELSRHLALKVLLEEHQHVPELVRRFQDEARICGQLQHPGIVPIHELGRLSDQRPFFTMKLIQGQTLATLLQQRRDPSEDLPRFLGVFEQVCQTVGYAHSRGVLHRDLKPSNIMVGNFGEVQVMDWGLAKVLSSECQSSSPERTRVCQAEQTDLRSDSVTSLAGTVMGSPGYMAPEQARGEIDRIDARSDVFGLGAILCVILTGKPPFEGATRAEVHRQAVEADLAGAHARLRASRADTELVSLARACLAVDPKDRPHDAGVVARTVTNYRASVAERLRKAELERATAQAKAVAERKTRRLTVALAGALVALLLLGGCAWFWLERDRAEKRIVAEHEAEQQMKEALRLRDQGRAAPVEELTAWTEALTAARRAVHRLTAGNTDPVLRTRAEELLAKLERELKDRRMLARLEEVRLRKSELKDNQFDINGAVREYAAAFRVYGIDVEDLPAGKASTRIRESEIARELVAALDDWGEASGLDADRRRLLEVAREADLDPWRRRLRAALAEKNHEALMEAAQSKEVASLPPATLYLLAKALDHVGDSVESLRLLRLAQRLYPDDFWLNFQLAFQLANAKPPRQDEAIRFYTAALAVHKHSAGICLSLGNALASKGALDEAIGAYREAIRLHKDFALAHYNLANLLNQKGLADEAFAEYREAIRLKPNYVEAHNNLGSALADRGRLDEACTAYNKALSIDSHHAGSHHNLALVLMRRNEWGAALAACRQAIRDQSHEAMYHNTLAQILDKMDRRKEAIAAYREALRLNPQFGSARANLTLDYLRLGAIPEALLSFRDSARAAPNQAEAHYKLGNTLMKRGWFDEAIAAFRVAVRIDPGYLAAWLDLGTALSNRGLYEQALAADQQVVRLRPSSAMGYVNLGLTYGALGDLEQAVVSLRTAVRLRPNDATYHFALANALDRATHLDEAVASYREAVRLKPDYAQAHNNLGNALAKQGELDSAVKAYRSALRFKPDHVRACCNLAAALHEQGRIDEAIASCREALRIQPSSAQAYFFLGLYVQEQGRLDEARDALRRAHELGQRTPGWTQPAARKLKDCERLLARETELSAYRAGTAKPADVAACLDLAYLCLHGRSFPVAAARLYRQAFTEQPTLSGDLQEGHRYRAARAAALAGLGRGDDAGQLSEEERADWRRQALAWLRTDLEAWRERSEGGSAVLRGTIKKTLRRWRQDEALCGLREAEALAHLPDDMANACRRLWDDVDRLLAEVSASR